MRYLIVLTTALVACAPSVKTEGQHVAEKYECNRCHTGLPGIETASSDKNCVSCHSDVMQGRIGASDEQLHLWRSHITSLLQVPSLEGAGKRLQRAWVRDYLLRPYDQRPRFKASMPKLPLSSAEAEALALYLVPTEDNTPIQGDAVRGQQLYASEHCDFCHDTPGEPIAPDLYDVGAKLQRGALAEWIRAPRSLKADTTMPALDGTPRDARDIASYLLTRTRPTTSEPPFEPLPLLERRVSYAEVRDRVFVRTCRHCHAAPDLALGDGGPGNTGGFGFAPRGFDITTYQTINGGVLVDGGRVSVFKPMPDGTARLLATLIARQNEERGIDGPLRGMPLGLPAVSAEDIQLVATWIAQGRPE